MSKVKNAKQVSIFGADSYDVPSAKRLTPAEVARRARLAARATQQEGLGLLCPTLPGEQTLFDVMGGDDAER